jgi:transcriptional regulator with XRE-family HTH domain
MRAWHTRASWRPAPATALGYGISRSQIANYESGRKKSLDVAELLVIAAALQVPPLQLLFPDEPDDDIEMLPGQRTSTFHATAWFTGGPGPMWPGREVAELTEKLIRMDASLPPWPPVVYFPSAK